MQSKLIDFIQKAGFENLVIMTDLDGTMLDFKSRPEDVTAPSDLVQAFQRLNSLTQGQFYIISGRDLGFIDSALHPFKARVSAEHHCLARFSGENETALVTPPNWPEINPLFDTLTHQDDAVWIEKTKTFSRTVHYRGADENCKKDLESRLLSAAGNIASHYNQIVGEPYLGVKLGADAIEIGPKTQDKGAAVRDILSQPGAKNRIPVYFGDAEADRPAGEEVKRRGGIFISVGPIEELKKVADVHLESPAAARQALYQIVGQNSSDLKSKLGQFSL